MRARPEDVGQPYPAVVTVELDTGEFQRVSGKPAKGVTSLVLSRSRGLTEGIARFRGTEEEIVRQARAGANATSLRARPYGGLWRVPSTITAALCTLGSHPRLPAAVQSLLDQSQSAERILVVDNAPATGATEAALAEISDSRLRVVPEPRLGLSHARNRALAECDTELLAFTDDDATADKEWLAALRLPFSDELVAGVTGLVMPAELRTEAQREFETYVGFGKGVAELYWSTDAVERPQLGVPGPRGPLFPWTTGKVGAGANMAFRTSALRSIGGFDTALGAGTIARGGEDLDAFSRVLNSGGIMAYTPHAVVWHYHREDLDQLKSQIRANGVGTGALLSKAVAAHPGLLFNLAAGVFPVARGALGGRGRQGAEAADSARSAGRHRRPLLVQEMIGLTMGPICYLRSARDHR